LWIEHPDPISGVLAWLAAFQLFSENTRATLMEISAQSCDSVGQNRIIFGNRVLNNDRVKHAKPAGEQERCR
jgi:hypothetical protein